jgi:hypothetical protein
MMGGGQILAKKTGQEKAPTPFFYWFLSLYLQKS